MPRPAQTVPFNDEASARAAMERQQHLLQAVSTALSLYITSDGKSEVFARLLESICDIVRPTASFLAEMMARANGPQAHAGRLEGVFLGVEGAALPFQLDDMPTMDALSGGQAVVLQAGLQPEAVLE